MPKIASSRYTLKVFHPFFAIKFTIQNLIQFLKIIHHVTSSAQKRADWTSALIVALFMLSFAKNTADRAESGIKVNYCRGLHKIAAPYLHTCTFICIHVYKMYIRVGNVVLDRGAIKRERRAYFSGFRSEDKESSFAFDVLFIAKGRFYDRYYNSLSVLDCFGLHWWRFLQIFRFEFVTYLSECFFGTFFVFILLIDEWSN